MKHLKSIILEKLKVSKNSNSNVYININLGYFLAYELGYIDTPFSDLSFNTYKACFDEYLMYSFELAQYFGNDLRKMYNFFLKHENDVIEVEETEINPEHFDYTFEIDGKKFESQGWGKSLIQSTDDPTLKQVIAK